MDCMSLRAGPDYWTYSNQRLGSHGFLVITAANGSGLLSVEDSTTRQGDVILYRLVSVASWGPHGRTR